MVTCFLSAPVLSHRVGDGSEVCATSLSVQMWVSIARRSTSIPHHYHPNVPQVKHLTEVKKCVRRPIG